MTRIFAPILDYLRRSWPGAVREFQGVAFGALLGMAWLWVFVNYMRDNPWWLIFFMTIPSVSFFMRIGDDFAKGWFSFTSHSFPKIPNRSVIVRAVCEARLYPYALIFQLQHSRNMTKEESDVLFERTWKWAENIVARLYGDKTWKDSE